MASRSFESVAARARALGLLLLTDAELPSVSGLVAGEPVRGSWWAHRKAHEIFRVAEKLGDDPDFLVVKLVSGKLTFVHRRLWPALLAVACSRESWQLEGLSSAARRCLRRVEADGSRRASGSAATELESRLLVHAEEVHTESGRHEKILETWSHWSARRKFRARIPAPGRAKQAIEASVEALGGKAVLPWTGKS